MEEAEREGGAIVDELRYEFSDNSIGGWQASSSRGREGLTDWSGVCGTVVLEGGHFA